VMILAAMPASRRALQDVAHEVCLGGPGPADIDGCAHQHVSGPGTGCCRFIDMTAATPANTVFTTQDAANYVQRGPNASRYGASTVWSGRASGALNDASFERMYMEAHARGGRGLDARSVGHQAGHSSLRGAHEPHANQ